jgi:hypothetical protein
MLTEIQGIHILLERWIENPDAPASEISPFTADRGKSRPLTREEIARKIAFMRRHAPTAMASLTAEPGLPGQRRGPLRILEIMLWCPPR